MRLFELNKKIPYQGFKFYVGKRFKEGVLEPLQKKCCYINNYRCSGYNSKFEIAAVKLITYAQNIFQLKNNEFTKALGKQQGESVKEIYDVLSVESPKEAEELLYSTPYIEDDYIFNLLEYSFYSLVLTDKEVERRFRTCYELWQNCREVGLAGYSEKLEKFLPNYITKFGNRIFFINPIEGTVKFFDRRPKGDLKGQAVKGVAVGTETLDDGSVREVAVALLQGEKYVPLVEVAEYGTVKELYATGESGTDRKAKERQVIRDKGGKITDNYYLTTDLDVVDGSAYNIRTHSLIALCVYGLEVMKYGIMEHDSIFTVDHINGNTIDNRIDNLQLLTRKDNKLKEQNPNRWYFDYFGYWVKQLEASKKNQLNLNFRSSI